MSERNKASLLYRLHNPSWSTKLHDENNACMVLGLKMGAISNSCRTQKQFMSAAENNAMQLSSSADESFFYSSKTLKITEPECS